MGGDRRFAGQTAVITGSGRRQGLGEAIAKRLAQEGANIVISDIGQPRDAATGAEHIGSTEEMEAIAGDVRALGVGASTCVCDVRALEGASRGTLSIPMAVSISGSTMPASATS